MERSSLEKTKALIIKGLYDLDINPVDKGELAINLCNLLDPDTYDRNIKTLRQQEQNDRQNTIEEYTKTLKLKGNNKNENKNE